MDHKNWQILEEIYITHNILTFLPITSLYGILLFEPKNLWPQVSPADVQSEANGTSPIFKERKQNRKI